jgi:tRNA (adenine37-N6)-methyltransferase
MSQFQFQPIGFMRSPYGQTTDVPKGLGAEHSAEGVLEVLPEFAAGLQDIEGFSHLFVIWVFHQSKSHELVGPCPADSIPHGVFATRVPGRPNPIGLTVVELLRREENRLFLKGVDMLDGTPILDIKPYLTSIPQERLRRGWLAAAESRAAAKSSYERERQSS